MRQNLRNARRAKGMTQQAVADYLNISLRYYQRIENGANVGSFGVWDALEELTGVHQRILRECGHCTHGRIKYRKVYDLCEHFESRHQQRGSDHE